MDFKIDPYENELVTGCLKFQREAQKQLYMRYKDAMYTILVRMLNNHEDAADALQEAFIKVFSNLANFQKRSSLGAWIKTIVVREALSRQKQSYLFRDIDQAVEEKPIIWDSNLTGEYLAKAIAQLSEGYRNIFLLVEVEGYTHRETAQMLGIAEGTSKSQLYHAKRKLQEILQKIMD